MSETKAMLLRLLRRIGREAARCERWSDDTYKRESFAYGERCAGEANVLRMAQEFIREEIRKVKP